MTPRAGMLPDPERHLPYSTHADAEVGLNQVYPEEYKGPRLIVDQIKAIAKIFGIDPVGALEYTENLPDLPKGAEGWFAIPSVDALTARHFPEATDFSDKYCRAVQLVHTQIAERVSFYNHCPITPERLKMTPRTERALRLIATAQRSDILIVAAQLGSRYHGQSNRQAIQAFAGNEFGLGALAVGATILVCPKRLIRWGLQMDCPGDELTVGTKSLCSPVFWRDDGICFHGRWIEATVSNCGPVSGFLPHPLTL